MITSKMKWYGDDVVKQTMSASWENLVKAIVYYHTRLLEAVNVSNPRPHVTPSQPGEPPRKRTGWLQRHIRYELDQASGRGRVGVAVNAIYGLYLELGTRRMRARPWLLATLRKHLDRIRAIAGGK